MKTLSVKEITMAVSGELVKGSSERIIENVVTHPNDLAYDTLLFDLDSQSHFHTNVFRDHPLTVVVTENAHLFMGKNHVTVIQVKNVKEAFQRFIRFYRQLWDIPVVGVTGTCGKTTVKEMIAHILSKSMQVVYTDKSKNSLERNLRYLLRIDEKIDAAVLEMGVACPDDLIQSCNYFQPDIGIITTIGTDHLEHCGSQDNYVQEKAKLLKGMKNRGFLILNADNEYINKMNLRNFSGKIIYFGFNRKADFRAKDITYSEYGMKFTLLAYGQSYRVYVPGFGEHNVRNALAAIAASHIIGIRIAEAVKRIGSFRHVESHLEMMKGYNGSMILDDTWSANPTSAEAALDVIKQIANGRRTVVVFGEMALLGEYSHIKHREVGKQIQTNHIHDLITIDKASDTIASRAIELGMNPRNVYRCESMQEFTRAFLPLLHANTVVLLKTSMLDPRTQYIKQIATRGKSSI
ncbi:UDP-N-acetylmuramoyl-tripeptide--D-alanyl-D-alanine ligase [Aneurinibacillus soli]|uniref:UDP-N-acetylmuramoyl-tripeptide--D-alanyl-D-alanine ligase n=3 Tax=Aneurinibacillus soli TaxID=1500254 RepID=A0A0U4WGS0_9BACL|nr:UDP-N-acetylmuramoyl-tripeptide--D-alanyl-D-alanine ligase [Aneurinibacillus soli]BAU27864.1 UDP-N-acetylmuramoyl-tripeptide--D-alanyl-D-alanine ligase [Aneurinibacillus soli]